MEPGSVNQFPKPCLSGALSWISGRNFTPPFAHIIPHFGLRFLTCVLGCEIIYPPYIGTPGAIRTHNLLIRSQALCPLSYGGVLSLRLLLSAFPKISCCIIPQSANVRTRGFTRRFAAGINPGFYNQDQVFQIAELISLHPGFYRLIQPPPVLFQQVIPMGCLLLLLILSPAPQSLVLARQSIFASAFQRS